MHLYNAIGEGLHKGYKILHPDGIEVATVSEKDSVFISVVPEEVEEYHLQKVTVFLKGMYYVGGSATEYPYLSNRAQLFQELPNEGWELYSIEPKD